MTTQKRAEMLFNEAKANGMINHITGDGAPSISMVIDSLHDAEADAKDPLAAEEYQSLHRDFVRVQIALAKLNFRVHSLYDFNADPDGITKSVGEALAIRRP